MTGRHAASALACACFLAAPAAAGASPVRLAGTATVHYTYDRPMEEGASDGNEKHGQRDMTLHIKLKQVAGDPTRFEDAGTTIDMTGDFDEKAHCTDIDGNVDSSEQTIHEDGHGLTIGPNGSSFATTNQFSPIFDFRVPYHASTSGDGCGSGFITPDDGTQEINLQPTSDGGGGWSHLVRKGGKLSAVKLDYSGTDTKSSPGVTTTWKTAGTLVASGGSTKSASSCKVPQLHKLKLAEARTRLKKANCALGKVRKRPSKAVKKGRVVSQSLKAGTTHPAGTKVAVVVSSG